MGSDRYEPRGLRAVAWVALAALSCATVRVPASGIDPTVKVRGDVAEPQVELWVESGKGVSAEERAQYAADARAALEEALASRRLAEGDQLLVVRAQGVSRTGSRRTDQKAAIAGLVVVGVAIVAVAIVAIVASKGKAAPRGAAPVAAAPPPGVRPAPPPGVPAPRPPPPAPVAVAPVRPAGTPGGHAHVAVGVGVNVGVVVPPDAPPPAVWGESVVTAPGPTPGPTPVPGETLAEVALRAPPPIDVARRGFFAGDLTRLELTLVDRATSRPLWVKTVEREIDPRDAGKVRDLLWAALDDPAGWTPADTTP